MKTGVSMSRTTQAFILSAVRTPIGRLQGALSSVSTVQLGATVVRAAVSQAGVPNLEDIDEVLMGNVVSAGLGQNIARQCAIRGGLPSSVGATTVNKVCGASLKAAMLASQAIRAGDGELFVVGGVENMSNAPYLLEGRLNQLRYGHAQLKDALIVDGLWCAFEDWAMGNAAEFIADEYEVTREAMDEYALSSHRKAITAIESGKFKDEIVPVHVNGPKGETFIVEQDEAPRRDTSLEALAKLPPAFRSDGRVTAGNAPGLNDAASALVIGSEAKAKATGAQPLARIVGYTQVAVEPKYIFDAPAKAIPRLLTQVRWTLDEVDLIELNEAFAAQTLANGYALADSGWNWDKVPAQKHRIHGPRQDDGFLESQYAERHVSPFRLRLAL
jgi:acetyl-CoA C-acetyltransferase